MLEKLAYWNVLMQLPIYIAQKNTLGGLGWEQTDKGLVFFFWVIVQNIVAIFAGGFADRFGFKRVLYISFIIVTISYFALPFHHGFLPVLVNTLLLGFGLGIFKPTVQGMIATTLERRNSSVGWGIYFMLMNFAVMIASPISSFLKSISWDTIFIGSGVVFSLNFIIGIFISEKLQTADSTQSNYLNNIKIKNHSNSFEQQFHGTHKFSNIFKESVLYLIKARIIIFMLLMTGFFIIYMQFYETLQNFIVDWSDTSSVADNLGLGDTFTVFTDRGRQIGYEWIYFLNPLFIILLVVSISWLFSKSNKLFAISLGVVLASLGLLLAGFSMSGYFTIAGVLIYTLGEMITNPKFNDVISSIAPEGHKAQFMGFINIPIAIAFAIGAISGGWIYQSFGEKAGLAARYMNEHLGILGKVELNTAFTQLGQLTGMNATELTTMLWNQYHPNLFWLIFATIGLASTIGIFVLMIRNKGKI
jgi:proton-dependent oligopeptide transporter, POT family